jgi:hypothetical protein
MKTSVSYQDVIAKFTPERRRKIALRAAELIAEEFSLGDLRKAKRMTQEQVARRLGGRQVYVSRLEHRSDMKLSTLREYVRAIGGDLQLMVTFPRDRSVNLRDIGEVPARRKRTPAKRPNQRKSA